MFKIKKILCTRKNSFCSYEKQLMNFTRFKEAYKYSVYTLMYTLLTID